MNCFSKRFITVSTDKQPIALLWVLVKIREIEASLAPLCATLTISWIAPMCEAVESPYDVDFEILTRSGATEYGSCYYPVLTKGFISQE